MTDFIINQSIIYFKQPLLVECRLKYTYTHVDRLYKNADKMHVKMVKWNKECLIV